VNFLTIYISEAHAMDEWPYGNKICLNQPKTMEERLKIANQFVSDKKYSVPMVVDSMDNKFETKFAAWPERYYILGKESMLMIGYPGETASFDLAQLKQRIQILTNKQ